MAINLNTLTSPATSGEVLQEVLTTADFLESCPVLRNLSRGSNKGSDAKQSVSLNQPKALPLIDGDGYLYLSGVAGNYASTDSIMLPATGDFDLSIDFIVKGPISDRIEIFHQYDNGSGRLLLSINSSNQLRVFWGHVGEKVGGVVVEGQKHTASLVRSGSSFTLSLDGTSISTWTSSDSISQVNSSIGLSAGSQPDRFFKGAIFSVTEGSNTNIDFTATNVRHGDTKFKCATGQVVTVNQSGNDPAKIIKRSVLRFDGVNSSLQGLFANNIDGGYMFAAFSVLGDGGETYGRIFSVHNSASAFDYTNFGFIFSLREQATNDLASYYNSTFNLKNDLFDADNGDILHEVRSKSGQHLVSVNGDSFVTNSRDTSSVDSNTFNISRSSDGGGQAAIDLEFLALFPASITDDQADSVRNYINNRNLVFLRHQTDGYYFYDAQKAPVGAISSGSSAWNGRIVGSDNGDADKLATQATANDQPVSDGYVVTFADNTDHLDIPSTSQAGWQIVGSSLGTFVYRVNASAQLRLNLLGYRGSAGDRKAGDLYGIILLPESATSADIESARRLLIDRGASESVTGSSAETFWLSRSDIVEFESVDFSGVANVRFGWNSCSAMTKFNVGSLPDATNVYNAFRSSGLTSFNTDLPLALRVDFAWKDCASLASFGAVDIKNCTNFTSSWQGTSALTAFPAGAKLGTEATNVNFTSAWQSSGLTSFELDLSTGNNFTNTFRSSALTSFGGCDLSKGTTFKNCFYLCSNLTQISASAKFGTDAVNVDYDSAFASTGLTAFPVLDLSNGTKFYATWFGNNSMSEFGAIDARLGDTFADAFKNCSALTSFPSGANLGTEASNVVFSETWRSSGLTSFSTPLNTGAYLFRAWRDCSSLSDFSAEVLTNWNPSSITTGVFNEAWDGCTSLTAQSVENILTSIDASGKYATTNGASGGTALGDAAIDIDYNTATGSLSTATNSAVTSLKAKGWSIIVNNVTL